MASRIDDGRMAARIRLVEEHVRAENAHDLGPLMATLGKAPTYDLNDARMSGQEAIHAFYAGLMEGFPDFSIAVKHRLVSDDAIVLEVVVTGTHEALWNGIPPTGRRIKVPVCAVFPFDADERIAGERVYVDFALWFRQLGVLPEIGG